MFLECFCPRLSFVSRRDAATKGRYWLYWAKSASAKCPNAEFEERGEAGWRVEGVGIIFNEITIIWLYEVVNVIH